MTDLDDWEQKLRRDLDEIRSNATELGKAVTAVRGQGEIPGVRVEVNAAGDITNLQIAPGAMRWTSAQLTKSLLDCHQQARTDARTRAERLARKADPRLSKGISELHQTPEPTTPRPLTEEEIQAADDAYFDRMNRHGWNR
ncbi:hypothetical protein D5S18_07980 [Nocardia panacis]|uniref:YbaB/EbfC family DNA-binding protein n=1 Tax=Nocardia panacis TaxID=2340916 RepID=A0A3A4K0R3_9NOCA|nr:hypothetical protein [Nocardia panacis]RJO77663.1 hypothetical protein D5S18_07980 [Nocardia panacis]